MKIFKRVLIVSLIIIFLTIIGFKINTKNHCEEDRLREEQTIANLKDFSAKINTAIVEYKGLGKNLNDLIDIFNEERTKLLISPSFERKEALPQAFEPEPIECP